MKNQKQYGEKCSTCRGPHDPVEHADRLDVRRTVYARREGWGRLRRATKRGTK